MFRLTDDVYNRAGPELHQNQKTGGRNPEPVRRVDREDGEGDQWMRNEPKTVLLDRITVGCVWHPHTSLPRRAGVPLDRRDVYNRAHPELHQNLYTGGRNPTYAHDELTEKTFVLT